SNVTVEPPKDSSHGDVSTNAAMVLNKQVKQNPRDIAEIVKEKLDTENPYIESVSIAGPGFINMRFKPSLLQDLVGTINQRKEQFADSDLGKNEKVNIEFVSANPTGPMHIGHARGAAFGDTLVRVMRKCGYDVTSEYYINDAGSQIEVLTRSAYLRYKQALGIDIGTIPDGLYPGDYLVPVGKELAAKYGEARLDSPESDWFPSFRYFTMGYMLKLIKDDLKLMGVEHDVFSSESVLHETGKVEEGLKVLEEKGLIYEGILEPPKGKTPEDWEPREQTLFKSSEFGDDVDRPIKKSDGSWTYFASDIAYHLDKYNRGYNHMILELGADHGGYLKRMKAAVAAISDNIAKLDIKFHQLVKLYKGGEPVKMSKRAGNFVTVKDVLDLVGKDVVRFVMLTRKNDAVLDFDLDKVQEQSKDNPIFYVQYAHARICSVLRNIDADHPDVLDLVESKPESLTGFLISSEERQIILKLSEWPRIVELSANHLEPHRIAYYLQELAAEFHSFWNKGKDNADLRFIDAQKKELTAARVMLLRATSYVIASGLSLFNITPAEEM
ncbi:MAG: arginine--tRNA ligase, partial [Rickettsiales bacterium]|nr:arginine--tRNA ligase [Rickettsiales bacterium]